MQIIDKIYIDGAFVTPHGDEMFDLFNPATEQVIGQVRLADAQDARHAIAAAKRAFPAFARTSQRARGPAQAHARRRAGEAKTSCTRRLPRNMARRCPGAAGWRGHASNVLIDAANVLAQYTFKRRVGGAEVVMQPMGVAGLITPWNSDAGFICGKLAAAVAAGAPP